MLCKLRVTLKKEKEIVKKGDYRDEWITESVICRGILGSRNDFLRRWRFRWPSGARGSMAVGGGGGEGREWWQYLKKMACIFMTLRRYN